MIEDSHTHVPISEFSDSDPLSRRMMICRLLHCFDVDVKGQVFRWKGYRMAHSNPRPITFSPGSNGMERFGL